MHSCYAAVDANRTTSVQAAAGTSAARSVPMGLDAILLMSEVAPTWKDNLCFEIDLVMWDVDIKEPRRCQLVRPSSSVQGMTDSCALLGRVGTC